MRTATIFAAIVVSVMLAAATATASVSPAVKRAALIAACFKAQGHKVTDTDGSKLPKGATAGVAWFSPYTYITWNVSSIKALGNTTVFVQWAFAVKQLIFKHNACVKRYSTD